MTIIHFLKDNGKWKCNGINKVSCVEFGSCFGLVVLLIVTSHKLQKTSKEKKRKEKGLKVNFVVSDLHDPKAKS